MWNVFSLIQLYLKTHIYEIPGNSREYCFGTNGSGSH